MFDTITQFVTGHAPIAQRADAGEAHAETLAAIDTKIVVSGVRGKSGTTHRLHDIFHERGNDTYAKITGVEPLSIENGEVTDIERDGPVRLYETEEELAKYAPVDVAIVENQGIRQYTTRVFNERFANPDVVFVTNIRRDHMGTLGHDRRAIAQSLARAIPADTHVVCGEQNRRLYDYFEREVERRGATVEQVDVPARHADVPGCECIYGLNHILAAVGEEPMSRDRLAGYLDEMRVAWTELPEGCVFNAAAVNDVESTEVLREALDGADRITPLLYVRDDRRGRTASFVDYLDDLHERGVVEEVHVVGPTTAPFERNTTVPTVAHAPDADAGAVLEEALAAGHPVMPMGNTVADFMRDLDDEIDRRSTSAGATGDPGASATEESGASTTEEPVSAD
jgi:hypothetical protein